MARTLTATQTTNVALAATRPVYIVDFGFSGSTEYLSATGTVRYGGQEYSAGGLNISRIVDSDVATLTIPANPTNVTNLLDETWRDQTCLIRLIPGAPADDGSPTDGIPDYTASPDEAIIVLDGTIQSVSMAGENIQITAKNKYFNGVMCPRLRLEQIAHHIPPVGYVSEWDGNRLAYDQWIKTEANIQRINNPGIVPTVRGRPSVSDVNAGTDSLQNTGYNPISGEGVYVPIVYGRTAVEGFVIAEGDYLGQKIVAVAWCVGPIFDIEEIFVNDQPISTTVNPVGSPTQPQGVGCRNYLGNTMQEPDQALVALITGYNDDLVWHFGGGDVGLAYSVLSIPPSLITGDLVFRAIIKGRLVDDPTSSPLSTDPFSSNVQLDVDFTTGTTDASQNSHTITLNGGASISSPSVGLELDGTGDYASIADDASLEVGDSDYCLEIEASTSSGVSSPEQTECLISHYTSSPATKSLMIERVGAQLKIYLSTNGTSWDIADGRNCGDLGSPMSGTFRLVVERKFNNTRVYLNGTEEANINMLDGSPQSSPLYNSGLYDSSSEWQLGAYAGTNEWTGIIKSVRLTIGNIRYGGTHDSTANSPYSDSGTYGNKVYSDNPALCWGDLASDNYVGAGATAAGIADAAAYCDGSLNCSPAVARCKIGLSIKTSRRVEQQLDLLASYANAIWFPEGSSLKLVADQANTASPEYEITNWVAGSLRIQSVETEQTPNMVTITYTVPSDTSAAWETKTYTVATTDAAAE